MDKKKIIIIVVALAVIGGLIWFFTRDGEGGSMGQQVSNLDAVDTVGTFYDQWLKAIKEPGAAEPSRGDLLKSPLLGKELKERLATGTASASPDPILCQTKTPEKINTSRVFEEADKAQLLVMSREKNATEAAIVTLTKLDGGWYIDQIECTKGDIPPPQGEFSFEKEGFLLKTSVPKPYDPKNWHLVFEENGQKGHVAPLLFDAKSECTALNGTKAVCKPTEFKEATKVFVQAQMTERGATVKFLKFVK